MRKTAFICACALILLNVTGCRLDYSQSSLDEEMRASIPNTILFSFTHTVIRDGKPVFIISAEKSESFQKRNQTIMSGINFMELDPEGTIITEGTADRALFHDDTENAEITGNIHVRSTRENGALSGDTLYWKSKEKMLTSNPETEITITRESGSIIRGTGFRADFKRRTMSFENDVRGSYETEIE